MLQPLQNRTALLPNTEAVVKEGIYYKKGHNKANLEPISCLEQDKKIFFFPIIFMKTLFYRTPFFYMNNQKFKQ